MVASNRGNLISDFISVQSRFRPPSVELLSYPQDRNERDHPARALHFRTAYRHTSDFKSGSIQKLAPIEQIGNVDNLTEQDQAVQHHYNRLIGKGLSKFTDLKTEVTNHAVYEEDISPLADSFNRLYPALTLTGLGDPTDNGTFLFTKGAVEDFRYVNLSAGEKAAFDLLLDLHIRRLEYPNSVICLDEPEAHIGLRVQGQLLDELLKVIPGAQLWIATHSPGMMRRAFERAKVTPGEVVFLNFDEIDFDQPATIEPSVPDRKLWRAVNDLALEDLAHLVAPTRVFLCEGDMAASGAVRAFDAQIYTKIFGDQYPDTDFVSFGGSAALESAAQSVMTLLPGSEVLRVLDRDSRTAEAIAILQSEDPGVRVLSERDLENYLLSDEILTLGTTRYVTDGTAVEVASDLISAKQDLLSKEKYGDDVKAVAGPMFEQLKRSWGLAQPGQNRHEFMRDICAPLITPTTETYKLLEGDLRLSVR